MNNIHFLNEGIFKATDEGKYDYKSTIKALNAELINLATYINSMIDLYTPILIEIKDIDINDQKSINRIENKINKNYDKGSEYHDNIMNTYSSILTDKYSRLNNLSRYRVKMAAEKKDESVRERREMLIKSCSSDGEIYNKYNDLSKKYKEFLDIWKTNKSKYFDICDKFSDSVDESMRINIEYLGKIYSEVINLPKNVIRIIK